MTASKTAVLGALVMAGMIAPTAATGQARQQPAEDFAVSNLVITLANSPESQYLTADFDVMALKGASLDDVLADMLVMAPDRSVVGQGGGASEASQTGNKRHFHIGPTLYKAECPPKLYPQQLILLSRYAVILEAIVVRPTVISSPEPGGCKQ